MSSFKQSKPLYDFYLKKGGKFFALLKYLSACNKRIFKGTTNCIIFRDNKHFVGDILLFRYVTYLYI